MQMWIVPISKQRARYVNLLPVCVRLIPERGTPVFIQCIQCPVFFFQENAESSTVRLRMKFTRLAVQLVVDLPADDCRMLSIMLCLLLHDSSDQLLVFL